MNLTEVLRLVFINIMENKFKVLLTSLGIIVGATTIILVIGIGLGGQKDVEDQFKNLSAGAIEVKAGSGFDTGNIVSMIKSTGNLPGGILPDGNMPGGNVSGGKTADGFFGGRNGQSGSTGRNAPVATLFKQTLTDEDVSDIELFVPNITNVTLTVSTDADVIGGSLEEATSVTLVGVKESYADISNLEMAIGEFITDESDTAKSKFVVLGYSLAEQMFDSLLDAFNSKITINDTNYTVIGVLEPMGSVVSGISPDGSVFIPYSTAVKYIFGGIVTPQLTAVASSVNDVPQVMEDINTVLTQNYPNVSFTVTDAGEKMEAASKSADTLSLLLIAVASIVFIVGGIGIMNVLFVSVKERTREIGILKALGCSKKDILMEFLFEANFISTFGGIIGAIAGSFLIPTVAYTTGMRVEPSALGVILAIIFAVITGTIFGFIRHSRRLPLFR